ncbi:LOW QUALITY PROTEIN: piggyBac transposable element-derived protein 4-like, partial [Palaemon carinicauda]|uniref:LOW QUALITY PROTEIN: piggyBac transposable element-derived protein 4-like n=1 Tax=Palaemon carinicauda TaxID=392227 RepID=UPI0035B61A92
MGESALGSSGIAAEVIGLCPIYRNGRLGKLAVRIDLPDKSIRALIDIGASVLLIEKRFSSNPLQSAASLVLDTPGGNKICLNHTTIVNLKVSDEEEPLTLTFEEDTIQDDLVDNETLLREENEDQLLAAKVAKTAHEERHDFAVSHAVSLVSVVPVTPAESPPSSASSGPSSVYPGPSSAYPGPSSAYPGPSSASPGPSSAYPAVPVPHLSPVKIRSRKRRRGPLCPAEGVALKRLPDNSYVARDNTKWHSEPNPTMPPILKIDQFDSASPTMAVFGCRTPAEVFDKFLTNIMLAEVVIHTNDKILTLQNKYKRQNDPTFKDVTLMELRAFLGILIMTGAQKDNHLTAEETFSKSLGCPFYRSIMSERRLGFIKRALRFDSIATREERVTHDKFAPIRNLWDQVIANCIANYEPSGHLTVDEQLLGFRGRYRFRMYIPNKPAKYGIKLVMACNADTFYMCNAIPYLGKGTTNTSTPLGEYFTLELTRPFRKAGRIVTTDNWFTSLPLAKALRERGMHLVGTIRPKTYLPTVLLSTPMELGESVATYNYKDKVTVLCQRVKPTKRIQILSTVHHNPTVIEDHKSHMHMFYNATKGGVDTFDQICSALTCSRKTRRWPVCVFYGIINLVMNNSFFLHQNLPDNTLYNRRQFPAELAMELARDAALSRLANKRYLPRDLTYLICSVFAVQEPEDESPDTPKRSEKRNRCPLCPSSSNVRTKFLCGKCHKPVCNSHVNYTCD